MPRNSDGKEEEETMPRDSDGKEEEEEEDKEALLSLDAILPDELLQKVLSLLPIADIIKLSIVCKRWYEVVHSFPPISWAMMGPQKPLFFRPCFKDSSFTGRVYDLCPLPWHSFDFPHSEDEFWRASYSGGLVCLMNPNDESRLLVGNPIKREWKQLPKVPGCYVPHFNAIALSFDRRTRGYTAVVAKCTCTQQLQGKPWQCHLSVHVYQSSTKSWATPFAQDLGLWMGSNEAVICDGVLYYSVRGPDLTHVMAFDLNRPYLVKELIRAPYPLHSVELFNLSDKLVMVGTEGYWPHGGVVIFELEDKTWRPVAQLPIEMYMMLGSNKFICRGAGDCLFLHSSMWQALLAFDMRQKEWKWSNHTYIEPLQFKSLFYYSFCFEPRLDVSY